MRTILLLGLLTLIGCSNPKGEKESVSLSKTELEKYDDLVWSAMLHYKGKDFENSLSNFRDAFEIKADQGVSDYFYASAAALNLNKDSLAKKLITDAITKTDASEKYFDNFDEFDPFRVKELFSVIKKNYAKHKAEYLNNLKHPEIYMEIESLLEKDQKVRTESRSKKEIRKTDSINISRLIEINKKYGWQKKQWLLLWHHRSIHRDHNYVWNFFRPFINRKIEEGELRKSFWARFDDEKSMFSEDRVQIYGTYWNNYNQFPIKDIDKVDSLRHTVGLPPLAYMEKVYGLALPEGYDGKLPLRMYKK